MKLSSSKLITNIANYWIFFELEPTFSAEIQISFKIKRKTFIFMSFLFSKTFEAVPRINHLINVLNNVIVILPN